VFLRTQFEGNAAFVATEFHQNAAFLGAKFYQEAGFDAAKFRSEAFFGGHEDPSGEERSAEFIGRVWFRNTIFFRKAWFGRVEIGSGTTFSSGVDFSEAWFITAADFSYASLGEESRLGPCVARELALFRTRFGRGMLIQVHVVDEIDIANAQCSDELNLRVTGGVNIDASKVHAPDELTFQYKHGTLVLAGVTFNAPTIIAAASTQEQESWVATAALRAIEEARKADHRQMPRRVQATKDSEDLSHNTEKGIVRLLSLDRVDATNLTLAGLDLRSCRFLGCHNRDQLRIEGPPQLAEQPSIRPRTFREARAGQLTDRLWTRWAVRTHQSHGRPRICWAEATDQYISQLSTHAAVLIDQLQAFAMMLTEWFGARLWTHRKVLADEHIWRARYDRRPIGWYPDYCRNHPDDPLPEHFPNGRTSRHARDQAAKIQALYHDLRKGREDAKDEPGAADFYYGEMEMRRLAAPPRSAERTLLTVYWGVAGYGLRATRALSTLIVVLALGAVGFATAGFKSSEYVEYRPVGQTRSGQMIYRQTAAPGPRPGWGAALDQSIESATSLLHSSTPRQLTPVGRSIELTLRLLGPALLGLAVFAVRSRVKR
ncbi:pentapeptide repeat-containing protein, partial [Nonomuraea sp. RK-328]|nr:pentapeptide repeat-containing protein [Nonomuraea sp. RK-328]